MPYTNDPTNVPADQVRFFVGDTSTTEPDLTDEEVAFLLLEENDNALRAAARAAETLASKYTKKADSRQVGPLRVVQSNRNMSKAQEFAVLARRLWSRAAIRDGAGPYAGGVSVSDKAGKIQDTDRVRPAFARGMMRYPGSNAQHGTTEELLSPPQELN